MSKQEDTQSSHVGASFFYGNLDLQGSDLIFERLAWPKLDRGIIQSVEARVTWSMVGGIHIFCTS